MSEGFFKVQGSSTRAEVDARFEEYARIRRASANSQPAPEPDQDEGEQLLEDREDPEVEADTQERSRAERVAARNAFILSVRDNPDLPTYAEQVEAIRRYDLESPL